MTADRPATEPRTEAGRALVKWAPTVLPDWPWLLDKVLTIEAEAAQGAAPRDPDARERGQNMQTAIEKGVLQNRESDLAYIGLSEGAAPRAEGLVSIRDALDYFLPFIGRDFAAKEAQERIDQRVKAAQALAPLAAPRAEERYFLANDPAVEALAALEHEQWEEWSRTIAEQGLTPERIERWQAYWVPYADLTDDVQEHDRVWARKAIAALRDAGYTLSRPSDERVPESEESR